MLSVQSRFERLKSPRIQTFHFDSGCIEILNSNILSWSSSSGLKYNEIERVLYPKLLSISSEAGAVQKT